MTPEAVLGACAATAFVLAFVLGIHAREWSSSYESRRLLTIVATLLAVAGIWLAALAVSR